MSIATQSIDLALKDKYTIICAPVSHNDPQMMKTFIFYATHISTGKPCPIKIIVPTPDASDTSNTDWDNSLLDYESLHKTIILYLWLSVRYPNVFVQRREALDMSKQLESLIMDSLLSMSENAIGSKILLKKTYSTSLSSGCHSLKNSNEKPFSNDLPATRDGTRHLARKIHISKRAIDETKPQIGLRVNGNNSKSIVSRSLLIASQL